MVKENNMGQGAPLPQLPQKTVDHAKKLRCDRKNCNSEFFEQVFRLKSISPILSPTGKTINLHFAVWVCKICGKEKKLPR